MTEFGGLYLLVVILLVGIGPDGINYAAGQTGTNLKCMVCSYPSMVDSKEDANGSLCLEPSKDIKKAALLYSKPCGKISDFLELQESANGDPPPTVSMSKVFLPRWRRECELSDQCNKTVEGNMSKKMLQMAKKDFKESGVVCKKMVVTSSSREAPGTKAWDEVAKGAENDKWVRVVRYCDWGPRKTQDGSDISYPTKESPFGNVGSLKILQHINSCIDKDNCNGAQVVQLGKAWALVLLLIKLF